jgi:DNA-binding CsgD family transcriptional regulator
MSELVGVNFESNLLSTNILNSIDAFVFIFDIERTVPVWINQFSVKRFGYSNQDLQNVTSDEFLSLFDPKSLQLFIDRLKNLEGDEDEAKKTIYRLKGKNKEWIHMLTCSRVFQRNNNGSIKFLIGFASEVDPNELSRHSQVMKDLNSKADKYTVIDKLSPRELDVVRCIASGYTDKEISEQLGISVHTTRTHRKRIISKLGLKNSAVLIKFAVENGIV